MGSTLQMFECSPILILYYSGLILVIEQAIGTCGDSEARTERFKTSHQDKDGQVVSELVLNVSR